LANWLTLITAESTFFNRDSLSQRWQSFAFEQVQARQEPPPLPLPAQDIYLLCAPDQGGEDVYTELYQYQLASLEWISHPLDVTALSLSPLPNDEAFLLLEVTDVALRTFLWEDNGERLLLADQMITLGQFDPTEQYLQVYSLDETAINRMDWAACAAGDCTPERMGGYPVWSPKGTDFIMLPADSLGQEPFVVNGRTLLFEPTATPAEWPLYRGSGQPPTANLDALTYLGAGYAPFWLDESAFGYVRQIPISSNSSRHELVLMSTTDETPRVILSETELQLALPGDALPTTPTMRYVTPHPQRPELLFIVALSGDQKVNVFSYNLDTTDLRFLLATGSAGDHLLGISPDGRYLVVTGVDSDSDLQFSENRRSDLYLVDLETVQVQTFAGTNLGFAPANTYDWSADGQWLVIVQKNQMLTLAAPAYDYQQFIRHNWGDCANAVWLNP
jgi:hypothetical protein